MNRILHLLLLCAAIFSGGPTAHADSVEPLLDGWVRQQKDPFNRKCPLFIDNTGALTQYRCQVGCVATALEMILSYHRCEIVAHDVLPGWESEHFKVEDIPAGTSVDTRLILLDYGDGTAASVGMSEEDYATSVDAVATLSLMCGMMAHMNWGIDASGADVGRLVEPMHDNIGWKTAEYIDSYMYTPEQWREILKNELRHGRPVLYAGYTMNIDGHAFVIDGFDENDRFHINWGYGGEYYGNYYDLTELATFSNQEDYLPADVMQGFFCNQQALILSPDEIDKTLIADSLKRSGEEVVIESVSVDAPALTKKFTPVTITVHNTADIPLCTPFEIFTNKPEDENLFKDGDYGALFGVNLQPDERRTMTVACRFSEEGERVLHISPDDVLLLADTPISVGKGKDDDLQFGAVTVEYRSDEIRDDGSVAAVFHFPVSNNTDERSGSLVTYCLKYSADMADGDWRHYEYAYLPAGANEAHSVTFRGLTPGDSHRLLVRCPWTVRQEFVFTVPNITEGVPAVYTLEPTSPGESWFDLAGRRATSNTGGLIIHGGKKILR